MGSELLPPSHEVVNEPHDRPRIREVVVAEDHYLVPVPDRRRRCEGVDDVQRQYTDGSGRHRSAAGRGRLPVTALLVNRRSYQLR